MNEEYVYYGEGASQIDLYREHKETQVLEHYRGHGKWVKVSKIDAMGIDLVEAPEWLIKKVTEHRDSYTD